MCYAFIDIADETMINPRILLVGGFGPSKKNSQIGAFAQGGVKIKKMKPPPSQELTFHPFNRFAKISANHLPSCSNDSRKPVENSYQLSSCIAQVERLFLFTSF